jgi:hypothetical protein
MSTPTSKDQASATPSSTTDRSLSHPQSTHLQDEPGPVDVEEVEDHKEAAEERVVGLGGKGVQQCRLVSKPRNQTAQQSGGARPADCTGPPRSRHHITPPDHAPTSRPTTHLRVDVVGQCDHDHRLHQAVEHDDSREDDDAEDDPGERKAGKPQRGGGLLAGVAGELRAAGGFSCFGGGEGRRGEVRIEARAGRRPP